MSMLFIEVAEAKYLFDYKILVVFNNGRSKVVDLESSLIGPVFEPLKDKSFFRNFRLAFNTLEWPNGADFAPEYLYETGKSQYPESHIAAEGD